MDISELKRVHHDKEEQRHPWEQARAKIIGFLLSRHLHVPLQHLTDIGSGDAYVADYLHKKSIAQTIAAIDTSYTNDVEEKVREKVYQKEIILYSSLPAFITDFTGETEAVLLLDVLEHHPDPSLFLNQIKNTIPLASGGIYIITVPAFKKIFSQHDVLLGHLRRYNTSTLANQVSKSGYVIIRKGYFFSSLLFLRIIQLFLEKMGLSSARKGVDNWNASPLPTRFFALLLWLDFRLSFLLNKLKIQLPGLSCYCICQSSPS